MPISSEARAISVILLVTVPTIALGGAFLLRMLKGKDPGYVNNPLRQNMFRAGHAHAGIMVILSLLCQLFADSVVLPRSLHLLARLGAPCAAVLMPLGFFLSVASPTATRPNRLIALIYVGALLVAASVLTIGVGLLLPLGG